ncbi:MAG: hypothetical protein WBW88_11825 [Rhodothermales bacterium]|jgi:hypothetical protein
MKESSKIDRRTFVKLGVAGAGGAPVSFPDFTRGKWKTYPKLEIVAA